MAGITHQEERVASVSISFAPTVFFFPSTRLDDGPYSESLTREVNCTGERRTGAFRVASLGGIQPERALGANR